MSNSEFKARALYDFVAEGPNELSFNANDILTITSNTAGHGWWYAKNASGLVGVIPENYVQALADPPEPNEPPPPLSTFSNSNNNYPNFDMFSSNNNNSRTSTQTSYPPPYDQHQYMNPTTYSNWQTQEPSARPSSPQQNQLNEKKLINSKQSLKFPTDTNKNSTNAIFISNKPNDDGYITVIDVSPPAGFIPISNSNSSPEKNSFEDESDEWYDYLPKTPAPILSRTNQESFNQTSFPFHFPIVSSPSRQTTMSDDYLVPVSAAPPPPPMSTSDTIDNVASQLICSTNVRKTTQSMPLSSSSPTNDLSSITNNNEKLKPTISSPENNTSPLLIKKKKPTLYNFLTLSRKQNKDEKKKYKIDQERSQQSIRRDTDSDDSFSDSDYPTASPPHTTNLNTLPLNSTLSNQGRASLANVEATKGPPRARFFDKHGLDNYLLNGSKAKSDEHVEISYDESEGGVYWSPNPGIPPFNCKVEDPAKGTKLGGLKAFTEYKIRAETPGSITVGRRYKQFDWLHEQLVNKFRFICIPPLPGKQIAGRFDQEFVEERRRQLELWLNRICRHPVLCASYPVQHFVACELTEKNKKDWKTGKRKVEKDELREASWLQCVTLTNTGLSDQQIVSQIEVFAQQQPGLESQFKTLCQGLTKYLEKHTEVYERDIQRVSELFSKVHQAVHMDTTTAGNKELSKFISNISGSYGGIADLYKTKATEGLRDFIERIQEYIGILASFPSILNIQRSASDFMKTTQQRGVPIDFSNAIHRHHVLNHVVLAEINFFQKEKVNDINVYMRTLVDEQIKFYDKVTSELRTA